MLRNIFGKIRFGYLVAFNVSILVFLTLFAASTAMNFIVGFKPYVIATNVVVLLFASPLLIGWLRGFTSRG